MDELMDIFSKMLEEFHPGLLIGTFVGFVFFIVEMRLYIKGRIFNKGKKKLERAKAAGHVVIGTLVSYKSHSNGGNARTYSGRYAYEVDGVTYYKYLQTGSRLPHDKCTLYYEKDPRKAKTANEMTGRLHRLVLVFLPFVVAGIVAVLLGFRPDL